MLQYLEKFISFLSLSISCFIVFYKISKIKTNFTIISISCLTAILISFFSSTINQYNNTLSRVLFIILICLSLFITGKKSINLIPLTIMSIGLSYCTKTISIIIFGIVGYVFKIDDSKTVAGILLLLIHQLLTIGLIKTRRFNNASLFLNNKDNLGIGLIISGFIFVFACIGTNELYFSDAFMTILFIGAIISSIGLFLWIRKSITEHYRKKLQAKADEHYQNTLAEKEQQIEQLNNSNAFLSKIVHRDNHIMSSLQHTITKYKDCDNPSEKEKLLNEILTLTQERSDLIIKEQVNTKVLPTTRISLIDGALSNMYIKATAHNIDFNLIINQDIHYLVNNLITQTDLETLLCDHIKDAIIAINSSEVIRGKILVTVTMNDDIYEISIKDNGVDFEVDTLAKLGLERITTHKDTGGSGIGFMTTFETLKKSNASLIITEYKTKTPFSKSITFRFDGLKAFIINSYRADSLKQSINRDDIVIM